MADAITVRVLPSGEPCAVTSLSRKDKVLELRLSHKSLAVGATVEVVTEGEVFLGPVVGAAGDLVQVEIEHWIDRERLQGIQRIWESGDA